MAKALLQINALEDTKYNWWDRLLIWRDRIIDFDFGHRF
jgi:hypothetical protein